MAIKFTDQIELLGEGNSRVLFPSYFFSKLLFFGIRKTQVIFSELRKTRVTGQNYFKGVQKVHLGAENFFSVNIFKFICIISDSILNSFSYALELQHFWNLILLFFRLKALKFKLFCLKNSHSHITKNTKNAAVLVVQNPR